MNKTWLIAAAVFAMVGVEGCSGGGQSPADQAQFKKQLQETHIDINQVPLANRARVQGFIDRANAMRAAAERKAKGQ